MGVRERVKEAERGVKSIRKGEQMKKERLTEHERRRKGYKEEVNVRKWEKEKGYDWFYEREKEEKENQRN